MDDQPSDHVRRTDEGASVSVTVTRGSGTRDQEKWRLKGKGESHAEAIAELRGLLDHTFGVDAAHGEMGDDLRELEPGEGDE
jgi:hypothetical protein